jgi:hypothetical protein
LEEGYLLCFGRATEVTAVASRDSSESERNMVPTANRLNIKKMCLGDFLQHSESTRN